MKFEHVLSMKTGNIQICWLYVRRLSSLTFSFCSTAKDWHLESMPWVPSSLHSWARLVTSEEIPDESSSSIWHLLTGLPSLGLSSCSLVFRYRWFVLAWLHLFTYTFIYCLNICSPLLPSTVTLRWIKDSWYLFYKIIKLCKWTPNAEFVINSKSYPFCPNNVKYMFCPIYHIQIHGIGKILTPWKMNVFLCYPRNLGRVIDQGVVNFL